MTNTLPKPLISVVMLTMPGRAALRSLALECLFAQADAPAYELIIALDEGDNVGIDAAKRIVDAMPQRKVIYGTWKSVTEKHNAAIAETSGEWVTLWDDDDWSAPDRLAKVAAMITGDGVMTRGLKNPDIVGVNTVLYHELTGAARRTARFKTAAHVVDGSVAFRRALWLAEAIKAPAGAIAKQGNVGDWIVKRVRGGARVELVDFGYVAMMHGKNSTAPREFKIGADGSVCNGPLDYTLVGSRGAVLQLLGEETLQRWEAAVR